MLTEKEKVTLEEMFASKLEKGEIDQVECTNTFTKRPTLASILTSLLFCFHFLEFEDLHPMFFTNPG